MGSLSRNLVCTLALVLGLVVAPPALAAGTTTSAGDHQYLDPLTTTSPATASTTPPAPPAPPTITPSSPTTTGWRRTHTDSGGNTLPYTGLDLRICVAVGLGLLGAGLLLRWAGRRP